MGVTLVTGGAGFIGSHLVEALVDRGERVRVLDNLSTGRRGSLARVLDDVEFVAADVRDAQAVARACSGVEVVFHQAALPSVPRSLQDPVTTTKVNVSGTLNVLLAAREAGVRRVVVASSSSVYGGNPTLPQSEKLRPLPLSPYAVSKLAAEGYAAAFWHVWGLETVALRYFNVFGPRQDPAGEYARVVPAFLEALRQGRRPVIYGDGEQSRDFTHVDNVVAANLLAAQAPEAAGEVFNVACGESVTVNRLVAALGAALGELLGTALEPEYRAARSGDPRHTLADLTAARGVLGYEPQVGFEEGLARTAAWYLGG
jgi:UDP-glucose 4-epimerase